MAQVGLVVVSHSRALAEAAVGLAAEMLHGAPVAVHVAAGLDDGALGTDATAIVDALGAADSGDGVVVLMDLGSAVLSAELALELLDDDARERVVLCPAPLVEGLVVAAVAAAGGAARDEVAAEALEGLAGKQAHLGGPPEPPAQPPAQPPAEPAGDAEGSFVVANPHGLHARPAARLVQAAAASGADVQLRNATTGSGWVPASSLSRVAVLGALRGHELQVRASGERAGSALDELLALAGRRFDEPDDEPAAPAGPPAAGPVGASPGVAVGPARRLSAPALVVPQAPGEGEDVERARLAQAREACRHEIADSRDQTARTAGAGAAAVFTAHLLLLDDADLLADADLRVGQGAGAAGAWAAAVERVEADVAALPDAYLRARAADVRAVGDAVLRRLLPDAPADDAADLDGVLVARDLTPAQAAALDPARTVGVVLAAGSPTAHSALLARARGVPAVVGAGEAVLDVAEGTLLALDGATGELVVDPADDVLRRLRERADDWARTGRAARAAAGAPARTRDGTEVLVAANVGSPADARAATEAGADLAGLVRTEFLFLGREAAPDLQEQEAVYREVTTALAGRRAVFRTLDVGGDKPLPYLPGPAEANPFLGVRGLRLSLARPGLLHEQLRALVRVARDAPVTVMFPMVTTLGELLAARAVLDEAIDDEGGERPTGLEVAMMVEVPAAALRARVFAPYVDLLSIGTNDLTQYALAADRGNPAVTSLGDPYDPAVLQLVAAVCDGAGGTTVAVCGELAADEQAAALLVGLGVRELSAGPAAVPRVKQAVRALDLAEAARTAREALRADGPAAVRALLGHG